MCPWHFNSTIILALLLIITLDQKSPQKGEKLEQKLNLQRSCFCCRKTRSKVIVRVDGFMHRLYGVYQSVKIYSAKMRLNQKSSYKSKHCASCYCLLNPNWSSLLQINRFGGSIGNRPSSFLTPLIPLYIFFYKALPSKAIVKFKNSFGTLLSLC